MNQKILFPNPVVSMHLNMISYKENHGVQMQLLYPVIIYKAFIFHKKNNKIHELNALYDFSAHVLQSKETLPALYPCYIHMPFT